MNIPEAIEILEAACNHEERFDEEELWDAQKLGIEALKRQLAKDTLTFAGMMEPLPGETEGG